MKLLSNRLASNQRAHPDDILTVKNALNTLNYYNRPNVPITPYIDADLFDGIKNFQRDNGLIVDGMMNPDGETERALRFEMSQLDKNDAEYKDFKKNI